MKADILPNPDGLRCFHDCPHTADEPNCSRQPHLAEDREAAPRTEAGRILLHEHSSGTPHMARHIVAIETEARGALSTAWAAAESALPEGWILGVASGYRGGAMAWVNNPIMSNVTEDSVEADTPAAALEALTARLQARSTEQGGAG